MLCQTPIKNYLCVYLSSWNCYITSNWKGFHCKQLIQNTAQSHIQLYMPPVPSLLPAIAINYGGSYIWNHVTVLDSLFCPNENKAHKFFFCVEGLILLAYCWYAVIDKIPYDNNSVLDNWEPYERSNVFVACASTHCAYHIWMLTVVFSIDPRNLDFNTSHV